MSNCPLCGEPGDYDNYSYAKCYCLANVIYSGNFILITSDTLLVQSTLEGTKVKMICHDGEERFFDDKLIFQSENYFHNLMTILRKNYLGYNLLE